MPVPELLTRRLRLRPLGPQQAHALLAGREETIGPWAEGYPLDDTPDAARGFLGAAARFGDRVGGFGMYQIVDRETGRVIGDAGFHGPPDARGVVMIGYGVVPAVRGMGITTEAVSALCGWALAQEGVRKILADTTTDNAASSRVLEKAGFRLVGERAGRCSYELPAPSRSRPSLSRRGAGSAWPRRSA